MPTIVIDQSTSFLPDQQDGWWDALTKTTTWSTASIDAHTWTVTLPGSQSLVFTSSAGFSTPRFPSDIPTGVVDTISYSVGGGQVMAISGLGSQGLSAAQLSSSPAALINGGETVTGSSGAETIDGGLGTNQIDGGGGADSILGGQGIDTLSGGDGNDTITDFFGAGSISGGNGDDTLRAFGADVHGDAGNDTIDVFGGGASGGDGDDTITSTSNVGVTITGDAGDDRIVIGFAGGPTTVDGGAGNDTVVVDYRGGVFTATQVGNTTLVNVEHVVVSVAGATNLDASALAGPVDLLGSGVPNHLTGAAGGDTISSGGGGDTVTGGLGDDVLDGGNTFFGTMETHPTGIAGVFVNVAATYDLVDYSDAPTGVVVDLNVSLQHTSLGNDQISNFEGVIGSQFSDTLVASKGQQALDFLGNPNGLFSGSRLYGGAGDDQLFGSAANDTLSGGSGADTVQGGAGADLFVLTPDGSTDRVVDFNLGEGDRVQLADPSGATVDASRGLLIWNPASHLLSWDPDSDAGPQAPRPLAVLSGVATFDRSDLAAGFQPSAIRVVAADGSRVETVFDWGSQAWDHTVATVDSHGAVSEYDVYNDDGTFSNSWFDDLGGQAWSIRSAQFDARGQLVTYGYLNDDGTETVWQFDTTNSQPWAHTVQIYSPAGQLEVAALASDDGSSWQRTFDYNNSQPWSVMLDQWNAAGQLISHTVFNDDGTVVTT